MASPTIIGTPVTYQDSVNLEGAYNITYTQSSTGQNRGLFVIWGANANSDRETGITWNGVSLTKLIFITGVQTTGTALWYLPNPATGSQTLTVTEDATGPGRCLTVFSLQDVVQGTGSVLDVTGKSNVASAATDSKSITTTVDGDIIVTWSFVLSDVTASIAPGGGQTALSTAVFASGINTSHLGSTIGQATAGAISTSMSWTGNKAEDIYVASLKYLAPSSRVSRMLPMMGVGK